MNLKLLAGCIIVESNLSKHAKMQLLNFIKNEATIPQVKAFILDGSIVHLDEHAIEIVNDRFAVSEAGGKVAQIRKTYNSAALPTGALGLTISKTAQGAAAGGAVGGAKGAVLGAALGAGVGASGIALWALYRKIRSKFDECTKKCGTYELNTARRQFCMARCKVAKLEQQLNVAIKAKNEKEINSKKAALIKAKKTFDNYKKSFKGKETP